MYDILDMKRVRVVRSGRHHRIGVAHIQVVVDAGDPVKLGDRLVFIGEHDRGVELEIIAVPDDRDPDALAVIHCYADSIQKEASQ
jgi:hypothetical protein